MQSQKLMHWLHLSACLNVTTINQSVWQSEQWTSEHNRTDSCRQHCDLPIPLKNHLLKLVTIEVKWLGQAFLQSSKIMKKLLQTQLLTKPRERSKRSRFVCWSKACLKTFQMLALGASESKNWLSCVNFTESTFLAALSNLNAYQLSATGIIDAKSLNLNTLLLIWAYFGYWLDTFYAKSLSFDRKFIHSSLYNFWALLTSRFSTMGNIHVNGDVQVDIHDECACGENHKILAVIQPFNDFYFFEVVHSA